MVGAIKIVGDASARRYDVNTWIKHEYYNRETNVNAIGMVKTRDEIQFNPRIRSFLLPDENPIKKPANEKFLFGGWGEENVGARCAKYSQIKSKDVKESE